MTAAEYLELRVDPEPPWRSVVIDDDEVVWQLFDEGYWYPASDQLPRLRWVELLYERGSVRVLWSPEVIPPPPPPVPAVFVDDVPGSPTQGTTMRVSVPQASLPPIAVRPCGCPLGSTGCPTCCPLAHPPADDDLGGGEHGHFVRVGPDFADPPVVPFPAVDRLIRITPEMVGDPPRNTVPYLPTSEEDAIALLAGDGTVWHRVARGPFAWRRFDVAAPPPHWSGTLALNGVAGLHDGITRFITGDPASLLPVRDRDGDLWTYTGTGWVCESEDTSQPSRDAVAHRYGPLHTIHG